MEYRSCEICHLPIKGVVVWYKKPGEKGDKDEHYLFFHYHDESPHGDGCLSEWQRRRPPYTDNHNHG